MCIVCDMKKAGASEEVLKLALKLADGLDEAIKIASEVYASHPESFSKRQCDRMQKCADLINKRKDLIDDLAGLQVKFVEVREGESIVDAVARGMAEVNADLDGSKTKH